MVRRVGGIFLISIEREVESDTRRRVGPKQLSDWVLLSHEIQDLGNLRYHVMSCC